MIAIKCKRCANKEPYFCDRCTKNPKHRNFYEHKKRKHKYDSYNANTIVLDINRVDNSDLGLDPNWIMNGVWYNEKDSNTI